MPVVRRNAIKSWPARARWAVWAGNWISGRVDITADGHDADLDAVVIDLAAPEQMGMIGAAIQALGRNVEEGIRGNR